MSITEYKVIKSPLDSIASIMATYIADGYQPVGQPVMQFPAEKTALQVVAKGADTAITDYDIIKAPTDSFAAAMATAIADGFQPFGQPIILFPDDKTILQAVIKGDANHNHAVTADAASGLEAAANIQELAVALSTRIKVLEDAAVE